MPPTSDDKLFDIIRALEYVVRDLEEDDPLVTVKTWNDQWRTIELVVEWFPSLSPDDCPEACSWNKRLCGATYEQATPTSLAGELEEAIYGAMDRRDQREGRA